MFSWENAMFVRNFRQMQRQNLYNMWIYVIILYNYLLYGQQNLWIAYFAGNLFYLSQQDL